ncbi:MAG TPA: M20/M25/M40 family metallo-hydrolase [Ardenticatenaceae bacterium]|nr:M20/M25/M40 family metallo-hydrolase [Ardenticatenaceae bacterium]
MSIPIRDEECPAGRAYGRPHRDTDRDAALPLLAGVDWSAARDEAVAYLAALLRIDTTNPPGRERAAADYLAAILAGEGLEPLVLESEPGRAQVVARLHGTGEKPPLLLFSHTDVVPVEPEHWSVPPFGGVVKDGYVWGRGALDMKGIVVMHLLALLLLKRSGLQLARDVIFAATADEERAGIQGMGWLVDHHPELIRAEYGLSEFGGYPVFMAGLRLFVCQTGEKGYCTVRLRVRGQPGHGSIPNDENALTRLAALLADLTPDRLPVHLSATMHAFVDALAQTRPGRDGTLLAAELTSNSRLAALTRLFGDEPAERLNAMLRNTATPTSLSAGGGGFYNVIPSSAEAVLDGRFLPGFDGRRFLEELRAVLGSDVELEILYEGRAVEFPVGTPLYAAIRRVLAHHEPEAPLVPVLMPGATDAKHVARLGTICYGFAPMRPDAGEPFMRLVHGHDERIGIESLGWGVRVLAELVSEFCHASD